MNNEPFQNERKELRELLSRLPNAPVASNFTARVMQAVELEELRQSRQRLFNWNWRRFFPRAAFATAAVIVAALAFHQHEISSQRFALAKKIALVADAQPLPSVDALKNFDAIQRMSQPARADDELLALASEMK